MAHFQGPVIPLPKFLAQRLDVSCDVGQRTVVAFEVKKRQRTIIAADKNTMMPGAQGLTLQWAKTIEILERLLRAKKVVRGFRRCSPVPVASCRPVRRKIE